jgi:outer membrane receptor protein involved in Fe transport
LFRKEVGTFTQSGSITGLTYAQTGAPISSLSASSPAALSIGTANNQLLQPIWTLSTTVNGSGASLQGIELALQLPFRTFVDHGFSATWAGWPTRHLSTQGDLQPSGAGNRSRRRAPERDRYQHFVERFKVAWNSTVYYDDGKFSARLMLSYRGRFHEGASGTGNVLEGYGATTNLDASIRYKITPTLEVSLEGNNLLDTYRYRFTDWDANRNYENNHFGRNILLGARFKY